jgi:hypothetical protein
MVGTHCWVCCCLHECAGDTLQPFCPALGAAIMGQHTMSIGSNQNFSIPINVLDAFGSKARRGPGSNWIVALSQNSGDTRQLSGNLRGALSGGYVVLQGLSFQAQPGSKLNLTLSAVPPPGSGDKVRCMHSSLLVVQTSYVAPVVDLSCQLHVTAAAVGNSSDPSLTQLPHCGSNVSVAATVRRHCSTRQAVRGWRVCGLHTRH